MPTRRPHLPGTPAHRAISLLVLLGLLALPLAACGSTSTATKANPPTAVRRDDIVIGGYAYSPAAHTVAAGTAVTFTNRDPTAHTATTTSAPGFDTGTLKQGQSRTITLSRPGTYRYYCQFHPFMHGSITVTR